jgi:hypothetical protein
LIDYNPGYSILETIFLDLFNNLHWGNERLTS